MARKTINIYVDPEPYEQIKLLAKYKRVSASSLVRQGIDEALGMYFEDLMEIEKIEQEEDSGHLELLA